MADVKSSQQAICHELFFLPAILIVIEQRILRTLAERG